MTASAALRRNAPDLADLDRRFLFRPFTPLMDELDALVDDLEEAGAAELVRA